MKGGFHLKNWSLYKATGHSLSSTQSHDNLKISKFK